MDMVMLRYRGVCLPVMASRVNMGAQQFTDGSQLI